MKLNYLATCFLLCITAVFSPAFTAEKAAKSEVAGSLTTPRTVDSINNYAFSIVFADQQRVIQMMQKNQHDAWGIKDTNGFLTALNIIGIAHDIHGNYDSSGYYFSKTLELSRLYRNKIIEEKSTNNLGMMNWNKGNLFIAQQYFFNALKISESQKNDKRISVALSNIGLIYQEISQYDKALEFHRKAFAIRKKEPSLNKDIALSYNNMAICYMHQNKIDSALLFVDNGLKYAREFGNPQVESNLFTTQGNCYLVKNEYKSALKSYQDAEKIKLATGNAGDIYKTYNCISNAYLKLGNPHKALEYAVKSKELNKSKNVQPQAENYIYLSEAYFALGESGLGEKYFELSKSISDSIFSRNIANSFAELQVVHETQQKESDLNQYKLQLAQEKLKVKTRNLYLLLYGAGTLIFLILAIGYYKKQKFKKEQLQKELILQERLAKAEMQNQLSLERMRISKDLHDNIGSQLTLVTSSLDNLSYRFEPEQVKSKLTEISGFTRFAIRQLRDSIWALNHSEFTVEEFHLRVLDYINKAKLSCPNIKFESRVSVGYALCLSPEQGINLLYVIQEILNNAIKYSGCSQINYAVSAELNMLVIELSDNGCGFRKEEIAPGNGLLNIDNRISKIGGTYQLDSEPEKGTSYLIRLKI